MVNRYSIVKTNHGANVILSKAKDPFFRKGDMKNHNYYVYMMASRTGTLYVGMTNDLRRRAYEHKAGVVKGFTQRYKCSKLVYFEHFTDINEAIKREKYIKGKKRIFKEKLIQSINPGWRDLVLDWEEEGFFGRSASSE